MDKFHEQLITTKKSTIYSALNAGFYICAVIALLLLSNVMNNFNVMFIIGFAIFAGLTVLCFYLRDKKYTEYEYTFTNGNLQVDVIYNMKKRKVVLDADVTSFEEFGKTSEMRLSRETKVVNCFPPDKAENGEKYTVLIAGPTKTAYVIMPDQDMLTLIRIYYRGRR